MIRYDDTTNNRQSQDDGSNMQGRITLAEYAVAHPDGTTTLVRSGINRLSDGKFPVPFNAWIVIEIRPERSEVGNHEFQVSCIDEDGKAILPSMKGQFETTAEITIYRSLVGVQAKFEKPGIYEFNLTIDRSQCDRWPLYVVKKELPKPKGKRKKGKNGNN